MLGRFEEVNCLPAHVRHRLWTHLKLQTVDALSLRMFTLVTGVHFDASARVERMAGMAEPPVNARCAGVACVLATSCDCRSETAVYAHVRRVRRHS
jgi:hypothetical protein